MNRRGGDEGPKRRSWRCRESWRCAYAADSKPEGGSSFLAAVLAASRVLSFCLQVAGASARGKEVTERGSCFSEATGSADRADRQVGPG